MSENCAVPLCLPNNCKWDEQTGEYSTNEEEERTSLYVVSAALERLRSVKGKFWIAWKWSQNNYYLKGILRS